MNTINEFGIGGKMKYIGILFLSMAITACTNVAGWQTRLNDGLYESKSGEFQVKNPIAAGFCLDIAENHTQGSEAVSFRECHGYLAEEYLVAWYTVDIMDENRFYKKAETSFIPDFAKDMINAQEEEEVMIDMSREERNGRPAVVFNAKSKSSDNPIKVRSSAIFYGDRILSISMNYDMSKPDVWTKPGSKEMFDNYDAFVNSFERK
jgi:hypothetical protein